MANMLVVLTLNRNLAIYSIDYQLFDTILRLYYEFVV